MPAERLANTELVLASGSPRRRELLGLIGLPFRTSPADIDESQLPGEQPVAYTLRLAREKARTAAATADPGVFVLAADTIVVDHGDVLDKPADAAEARLTLMRLRGRMHRVFTAIALQPPQGQPLLTDLCETQVLMRNYSQAEIQSYINSGDPFDKAGAYAIQHAEFQPVERLVGCYANVVGLPLCHLARTLAEAGVAVPVDVPAACQQHLGYNCPVYQDVLDGAARPQQSANAGCAGAT